MDKLVLYTNPRRARIARWMMEELGLPHDPVWLEFGSATCARLADRFPSKT